MSNLISIQEIMNAQHDATTSQPTRNSVSVSPIAVSGGQNLVKSGVGVLFGVMVGSPLLSAMQIWDNTVSGGSSIFKLGANVSAGFYPAGPGLKFSTGLTVSAGSVLDNIFVYYL